MSKHSETIREIANSEVGEGCGCLLIALAIAVLLSADRIFDLLSQLIDKL